MLMKLTPEFNFINILVGIFMPIFLCKAKSEHSKITNAFVLHEFTLKEFSAYLIHQLKFWGFKKPGMKVPNFEGYEI